MTPAIKLKKNEFGGYSSINGQFRVFNYMGLWTVCEDFDGEETLTDFMTLTEAREFMAGQVTA